MIREKHIGVSGLGKLTRKQLRDMEEALIVHYRTASHPVCVVVPGWIWTRLQTMLSMANDIHNCSGATEEGQK